MKKYIINFLIVTVPSLICHGDSWYYAPIFMIFSGASFMAGVAAGATMMDYMEKNRTVGRASIVPSILSLLSFLIMVAGMPFVVSGPDLSLIPSAIFVVTVPGVIALALKLFRSGQQIRQIPVV